MYVCRRSHSLNGYHSLPVVYSMFWSENDIFSPLVTHLFQLLSSPFCLNSCLFCIYFTLLLPIFSFSFRFSSVFFPRSSFFFYIFFPFHIFFSQMTSADFSLPQGAIFYYKDPCSIPCVVTHL
jgi:hypothetical protein